MIERLIVKNFKSLKEISIDFKNIQVLVGLNGMGKSSLLQVLLLLYQSYEQDTLSSNGLSLNGNLVKLGVGKSIFCDQGDDNEGLIFEIWEQKMQKVHKWSFKYSSKLSEADLLPNKDATSDAEFFKNNKLHYIGSDRISPQPFFSSSYFEVSKRKNIGKRGDFVIHYLDMDRNELIEECRKHKNAKQKTLLENTEKWLEDISPNIRLDLATDAEVGIAKVRYSFQSTIGIDSKYIPINVGFGITHILPIIVKLLSVPANSILIIENPESYIHPRGQESLVELMACVAQNNVQIILETHSDHIVHGLEALNNPSLSVGILHFRKNTEQITEVNEVSAKDFIAIEDFYSAHQTQIEQLVRELSKTTKPLIIAEGKTDRKHLEAALRYFKDRREFLELDIEFFQEKDEKGMGSSRLIKMQSGLETYKPLRKVIFIYDRDEESICKKHRGKKFNRKENVYSFCIPKPSFREGDGDNICIELYYKSKDLHKQDEKGRRMFLTSEFSATGLIKSEGIRLRNADKIKKRLKPENETVISDTSVYDREDKDILMSKNDFAENILYQKKGFEDIDFSEFKQIFEIIECILNS